MHGVPYQVVGGIRFYQRKEIKDVIAHLQLLVNPRDAVALHRVAGCRAAGVGEKTIEAILSQCADEGVAPMELLAAPDFRRRYRGRCSAKLEAFATWCRELQALPRSPVGECVHSVVEHSGLLPRLAEQEERDPLALDRTENIRAMESRAYEYQREHPDAGIEALLEEVALVSDVDSHDPENESLSLMTLHSSKGLEFPCFHRRIEEGYLPYLNSRDKPAALEEERRLRMSASRGPEGGHAPARREPLPVDGAAADSQPFPQGTSRMRWSAQLAGNPRRWSCW